MPWINEFHYDNTGTDEGEFIEIAGLAGTDLTGWSLVLYNGVGGLSYSTLPLSGILSNQQNGFGTLSFAYPVNGIQNGSPDGIALVDPSNLVIEFISYEGSFQATDGPANGMTSVDIGVAELGFDAVGGSIARTGTGNEASDFSWQLGVATSGLVNQTFQDPFTPDYTVLQFPNSLSVEAGSASDLVYGRIFEAGLTEADGAPATVVAQLGYGPAGSNPATSPDWVWVDAAYNVQVGNDDEYAASLTISTTGNFAYTFRFGIDDGTADVQFTYADLDGAGTSVGLSFDPGQLGSLTVNAVPLDGTTDPDVIIGGDLPEVIAGLEGNDQLSGGGGDDEISGGSGNDIINGGTGADELIGGTGDDRYVVDQAGDTTTELADEGIDRVLSDISWTLGNNLEILELTGIGNVAGTGNAAANTIYGNSAANLLNGGAGADSLRGGDGNDIYIVDNSGDRAVEGSSLGGIDTVQSDVSFILGANVERLMLTGTEAINGKGNELANIIYGNTAANVLTGGGGADSLRGGDGNDTYFMDNSGDRAVEASATGGTDTVKSSVSFTLGANVENLQLLGAEVANGTGNALTNTIYGNTAANLLNGGAGADSLRGGDGNDTYVVDNAGDRAIETSEFGGIDTVKSAVSYILGSNLEKLTLTGTGAINGKGNALANTATGNSGDNTLSGLAANDVLSGGAGADRIFGGTGADRLTGGADADRFYFDTALDPVTNVDRIVDFNAAEDTIVLDQTIFETLDTGTLDASAFHVGNAAADADDRIIYDALTGRLFYDPDGNGAALKVQFATTATSLPLTNLDVFISN